MWIEYLLRMYDSIGEFNKTSEELSANGWGIKDFRLVESPTHVNGVIVMWARNVSTR